MASVKKKVVNKKVQPSPGYNKFKAYHQRQLNKGLVKMTTYIPKGDAEKAKKYCEGLRKKHEKTKA